MKYLSIAFLTFLFLVGCKNEDDDGFSTTPMSTTDTVAIVIPTGNENYLNQNSDYIFDQDELPTFEINLPTTHLQMIDSDPAAEEYVEGSLTFEGETISPVGVRYKGSVGAFVNCLSGDNIFQPSGKKECTKLSMKIKINWDGREEKFFGLKKLQLHAQNLDASQMRERLAYWLFREMGVPAPRSIHARVVINGQYQGLYALTEQIDGRFTRYHFENGKGNLYKEIWPLNMDGNPRSEQTYIAHLKTNEDENPSAILMRTFAQEVADADDNNIKAVIEQWMDINKIIAYTVVDRTIRVDDGPFHWYCSGGSCEPHNFYWYEDPVAERMHLIPWDMDNAFENIIFNTNPITPIADDWGEISANCNPFSFGTLGLQQWSAACDKLTGGWVKFEEEYDLLLDQLKSGPLSEAEANVQLDKWANQIRAATEEASNTHGDAVSIAEWENALEQLKNQIEFAREN
ncbi:MAG: CotH kinase family protein [Bacteroidota bacterium]